MKSYGVTIETSLAELLNSAIISLDVTQEIWNICDSFSRPL